MTLEEAVDIMDVDINNYERMHQRKEAWGVIRKELVDSLKPLYNKTRDEICYSCERNGDITLCPALIYGISGVITKCNKLTYII